MTEQEFIFDPLNKVNHNYGYCMFLTSILSFTLINIVVSRIGPPKSVKGDPWRWNNLFISWIHAAICGTWDLLCLYLYPEMLDDLVYHINYVTYLMVAFSTGYFVYDFLDLMYNGKLRSNWEVTLHHIALSSVCAYHFHNEMCIAYTAIALYSEVNSIFLHGRKLLKLQSASHGIFYYSVCLVNIVTFIFFRFVPMYIVGYGILTDYHKVPRDYHVFLTIMSVVVMVINFGLFYQLISSDYRDFKRKQKAAVKKSVPENMDDNNHNFKNNNLKVE